jgi:hypothetical protein
MNLLAQFGTPGDILAGIALGFCGWVGISLFSINSKLSALAAQINDLPCRNNGKRPKDC